jgi:hypothetical protein
LKKYKDFVIVKALNRNQDLGLKMIDNKLYISILFYNKKKRIYEYEYSEVLVYDIDKLIVKLVSVMNNLENNVFYNNRKNNQDILMKLINYNKAFKLKNTLKLSLYSYIGINNATHSNVTISIDSARNLYRVLNNAKLIQNTNR